MSRYLQAFPSIRKSLPNPQINGYIKAIMLMVGYDKQPVDS